MASTRTKITSSRSNYLALSLSASGWVREPKALLLIHHPTATLRFATLLDGVNPVPVLALEAENRGAGNGDRSVTDDRKRFSVPTATGAEVAGEERKKTARVAPHRIGALPVLEHAPSSRAKFQR